MQPEFGTPIWVSESEADVVKLVDTPDLGSGAARHGGSSPSIRTKVEMLIPVINISPNYLINLHTWQQLPKKILDCNMIN